MPTIDALPEQTLFVILPDGTELRIRCSKTDVHIKHHRDTASYFFVTSLQHTNHGTKEITDQL
ncbi:MAG: hypothetical protein Unbinned3459contig1000_38 [Prokaryotic dsDNA virus sp.]|nr:MAG: hypothetical protein Unbinned3459contig1000_38 [Prokaryotic dsDNA virus sp.]